MSTNTGIVALTTNQTQKETTINNALGRLDAALTEEGTTFLVFAGADALKVITLDQMQSHIHFIVSGSTSNPNPVVKTANVKRGIVAFTNNLSSDLQIEDYGTLLANITIPAGGTYVIMSTTTGNRAIVRGQDSVFSLNFEASVKVATTANITLAGSQTIDGVAVTPGDRVLVKNQATGADNGVYTVVHPGAWTRAAASWGQGTAFAVEPGGTVTGGTAWLLTTPPPIVIGVTSLAFSLLASDFFAQFTSLTDTFPSYAGLGLKPLRIKADETGVEAADAANTIRSWINSVRVATTANVTIATGLNAGDSIDGVTLNLGDRVLVKNQSSAADNGIYTVDPVPFRSEDFDSDAEVTCGAMVVVEEGTLNTGKLYQLTTFNPISVGADNLVFDEFTSGGGSSIVDWKDSVRCATTANITIATALNNGDSIDGITLSTGDRVLVKDQSSAADNGVYVVGVVPARATDFDEDAEVTSGAVVRVGAGTVNGSYAYVLSTADPITVGVTGLTFIKFNHRKFTDLADTPAYAGNEGKGLRINSAGTAVEAADMVNHSWLPSVRVASTANVTIATALNNGDSIDGVTLVTGDRVLLKDQTAANDNGIYVVAVSPARALDFDASFEALSGAMVVVEEGSVGGGKLYRLSTLNPINLGVTNLTFTEFSGGGGGGTASVDWKDSVRAATTANITIATALNNADVLDGVTLATGDRVLVKNQASPADNGIYIVGVSPSRATDCDVDAEVTAGLTVMVNEGTVNADYAYQLTTNDPITLGVTGLTFTKFNFKRFTELADAPSTYTGQAFKKARVNTGETAIEFVDDRMNVAGYFGGAPGASVVVLPFVANEAMSFAAAFSGSVVKAKTAATAQTDFDVQKNGASIGTIRFAIAGTVATYVGVSAFSLASADLLEIVSPGTPDATLANIFFNFRALRAS